MPLPVSQVRLGFEDGECAILSVSFIETDTYPLALFGRGPSSFKYQLLLARAPIPSAQEAAQRFDRLGCHQATYSPSVNDFGSHRTFKATHRPHGAPALMPPLWYVDAGCDYELWAWRIDPNGEFMDAPERIHDFTAAPLEPGALDSYASEQAARSALDAAYVRCVDPVRGLRRIPVSLLGYCGNGKCESNTRVPPPVQISQPPPPTPVPHDPPRAEAP